MLCGMQMLDHAPLAFLARGTQVCSENSGTREVRGSLPCQAQVPCWPGVNFVVGGLFGLGVTSGVPAGKEDVFGSVEAAGRFDGLTPRCAALTLLQLPLQPCSSSEGGSFPLQTLGRSSGGARSARERGARHRAGLGLCCARRKRAGG